MLASTSGAGPKSFDELLDPRLLARLARLDVRSLRVFMGKLQGERRSKRRGRSVEFDDHRNYVPGDDPRFIDWSVYARLDKLFIKLFLEEEDLALHVVVDASLSMRAGEPDKLLFAARTAAALGAIGLTKQNRVALTVFGAPGAGIAHLADQRGRRNLRRFVEFLRENAWPDGEGAPFPSPSGRGPGRGAVGVSSSHSGDDHASSNTTPRAGKTTGFNDALAAIARQRSSSGVLIILSDVLIADGYERGLRLLAAAGGFDVYCLQVLAPGEIEPERDMAAGVAGDLRLTDIETGAAAEVTMTAALIKRYKERLDAYCDGLHQYCTAREMSHLLVRSDSSIEELLLGRLRKAGALG